MAAGPFFVLSGSSNSALGGFMKKISKNFRRALYFCLSQNLLLWGDLFPTGRILTSKHIENRIDTLSDTFSCIPSLLNPVRQDHDNASDQTGHKTGQLPAGDDG